jgi:hypothetical protein
MISARRETGVEAKEVPEANLDPLRPPGYFAQCYTAEEREEENRLAKSSIIRLPNDLE